MERPHPLLLIDVLLESHLNHFSPLKLLLDLPDLQGGVHRLYKRERVVSRPPHSVSISIFTCGTFFFLLAVEAMEDIDAAGATGDGKEEKEEEEERLEPTERLRLDLVLRM